MDNYSPFFPDLKKDINYTVAGIKPQTNNTTFYDAKDLYPTSELASERSYNIGCSGYRRILSSGLGEYKYAPCSDMLEYKTIMKLMPKIPVERRYYEFDPTQNIYDIRDSFNDNLYNGFDYKDQLLRRSLSNVLYRDPIKEGILGYFNRVVFGLVETTKQIKNFINYTVKRNNKRVF
ncbi:MAG: hypothetical protein EBW68_01605 [Actinobacteria bacterium]|jgi:hypothetical protein|nr:hypothetical protein [Actinomycetota bacterium]|tara:strand:+ start:756 stop:1286 length:531 start_codon:yes stop_codon:yes gene_type:complete